MTSLTCSGLNIIFIEASLIIHDVTVEPVSGPGSPDGPGGADEGLLTAAGGGQVYPIMHLQVL